MTGREKLFQALLRIIGTSSLFSIFAVMMPYDWMNAVHQWLGMGTLPNDPIVGYLARSLSAFYALLGGLLWVLSFDLRRYRTVLRYLGWGTFLFGLTLLVVDSVEHLPRFWRIGEGIFDAVFGLVILWLNRQVASPSEHK